MMAFDVPQFSFWSCVYTAAGASVFWGLKGRGKLRVYCLAEVVDWACQKVKDEKLRNLVEFAIFIGAAILIGDAATQPHNAMQAIAAGFGWTGMVSHQVSSEPGKG
jgi:hypothetical protein